MFVKKFKQRRKVYKKENGDDCEWNAGFFLSRNEIRRYLSMLFIYIF